MEDRVVRDCELIPPIASVRYEERRMMFEMHLFHLL
jgi:hypothetical protein